jgi:LAO/AO transport system kinase
MIDNGYIKNILAGDSNAVARAVSRVERGGEEARNLIRAIFSYSGRGYLVGVTGAPGTGKSTLVNELAKQFRARDRRVAIIAVDPTSPFTGGAILGDRLRMQDLYGTGVFIRSMAARGHLGGLAAATADAALVLDAAGFEFVFIETVGAGQGEVEIARNAHTTIVVEAPGMGDDIQAIKAGILEIADILVVNKADRDGANSTVAALEMNLNLNRETKGWRPPVLKTVALRGEGVSQVADAIEKHRAYLEANGLRAEKERTRARNGLTDLLSRELLARALRRVERAELDKLVDRVARRELDVYEAAETILNE